MKNQTNAKRTTEYENQTIKGNLLNKFVPMLRPAARRVGKARTFVGNATAPSGSGIQSVGVFSFLLGGRGS